MKDQQLPWILKGASEDPPTGDGRDPDCNDINYAIHTAAALCAQMTSIEDNEGPVPGTDTSEGLCAYCDN